MGFKRAPEEPRRGLASSILSPSPQEMGQCPLEERKRMLMSYPSKIGSMRKSMKMHIVCPFCEGDHSIPTDFDAIHRCDCGACYKVCGAHVIENGVSDIADELWSEEEMDFIRAVPVDFCNIVIEKDFEQFLNLKESMDPDGILRFCKFDMDTHLNLVWIKRLF